MTEREKQEITALVEELLAAREARVLAAVEETLRASAEAQGARLDKAVDRCVNRMKIELIPVIRKAMRADDGDKLEDWR